MDDRQKLEEDINQFVDQATKSGENLPDFWDENNTTERLAEFLFHCGWTRLKQIPRNAQ